LRGNTSVTRRGGSHAFAGGFKVQSYRAYFFDRNGHIERGHEFMAEDDEAAIRVAEAWREGRTMELWQRDRLLKRWDRPGR